MGTEPRRRWPSLLCDACTYSTFWVLFFLFSACWSRHSLPHSSLRSVRGFSIPVGRFLLLSFTGWGSRGVGRGAPSFVVDSARPLPLMLLRRRSHSRRHRPPPPASPAAHLAYRRAVTSQSRRSRGATRTAGGGGGDRARLRGWHARPSAVVHTPSFRTMAVVAPRQLHGRARLSLLSPLPTPPVREPPPPR